MKSLRFLAVALALMVASFGASADIVFGNLCIGGRNVSGCIAGTNGTAIAVPVAPIPVRPPMTYYPVPGWIPPVGAVPVYGNTGYGVAAPTTIIVQSTTVEQAPVAPATPVQLGRQHGCKPGYTWEKLNWEDHPQHGKFVCMSPEDSHRF